MNLEILDILAKGSKLSIIEQYVNKCNAFYIGETGQMLSKRVNGHRSTCKVVNSDLPVPIHTQFHQLPFQDCWSIRIITNSWMPPQTNLKWYIN